MGGVATLTTGDLLEPAMRLVTMMPSHASGNPTTPHLQHAFPNRHACSHAWTLYLLLTHGTLPGGNSSWRGGRWPRAGGGRSLEETRRRSGGGGFLGNGGEFPGGGFGCRYKTRRRGQGGGFGRWDKANNGGKGDGSGLGQESSGRLDFLWSWTRPWRSVSACL